MSGQGKYSVYVPVASVKNSRLAKLFRGNDTIDSPFAAAMASGDQEQARKDTVERAKVLLQPIHQTGDLNYAPAGVNMDFSGDPNGISPPDLTQVKWRKAGDPSNGYFPDLRSPGPGVTDNHTRDTDPEITIEEIEGQGYIPGQPGVSTATSPTSKIPAIVQANTLGEVLALGKSSRNEPSGF